MRISWERYLDVRDVRLRVADDAPASLPGWRCPTITGLRRAAPSGAQLFAALAHRDRLPRHGPARSAEGHERWLAAAGLGCHEPSPEASERWARVRLQRLGVRMAAEARGAWAEGWTPRADDAVAAAVWADLATSSWGQRAALEAMWLGPAQRAFRAVCGSRSLPRSAVDQASRGLRDALYYRLVLPDRSGLPGWLSLATRVLETAPAGPLGPLLSTLAPSQRRRLGVCAVSRGSWRHSAEGLLGSGTRLGRAREVVDQLDPVDQPHGAEFLLDHHVQCRLLHAWSKGRCDTDWSIITQARGRVRARVRRVAGERPDAVLDALLHLDALAHRSESAVGRWAWAWAWQELGTGFAFDLERPLSPPCEQDDELRVDLGEAARAPLTTWVLLVVLKGRLPHLRRWLADGGSGDRDSTWGRLLSESLPPALRQDRYRCTRLLLAEDIDARVAALGPVLERLADLPEGRGLRTAFERELLADWHPDVPFPRSGFPTFRAHARHHLRSGS